MSLAKKIFCFYLASFAIGIYGDEDEELFHQTISDLMTTPLPDFNIPSSSPVDGQLLGSEVCAKMGDAGALKVELAVMNLKLCALRSVRKSSKPSNPTAAGLKDMCGVLEAYKGCVATFLHEVEPCFENDQKFIAPMMQNMTITTIDFMCEDDARNTRQFLEEKGSECVRRKQLPLARCVDALRNEALSASRVSPSLEVDTNALISPAETADEARLRECKIMGKFRECTLNELSTCSTRIPATLVDKLFNVFFVYSSCDKSTP